MVCILEWNSLWLSTPTLSAHLDRKWQQGTSFSLNPLSPPSIFPTMHWGALGAYQALWKAVFCFSFSCCFFCILCFPLPGKECLGVRTELERVFVWVPPEADPWDNNLCTSCFAESSRSTERDVERLLREKRPVIKCARLSQLLQWGCEARSCGKAVGKAMNTYLAIGEARSTHT